MITLTQADPLRCRNWNDQFSCSSCSAFYATSNWAQVLQASFGCRPSYFLLPKDHEPAGVVPIMEIRNRLTGRSAVSLPSSTCCPSTLYGNHEAQDVVKALIEHGRSARWKYLDLRCACRLSEEWPVYKHFYGHVLDMTKGPDAVHAGFKRTVKQNIRKASKAGITVDTSHSLDSIDRYYRLHCVTRKRHGLLPQPYKLFKSIHKYVVSQGLGFVMLAKHDGKVVAGGLFFHCGTSVIYDHSASDSLRTSWISGILNFSPGSV